MPFNLLIFPIVGGYYILIRSELLRYRQQRVESQKLILNSILVGIGMLFVSWALTASLTRLAPSFVNEIRSYYPLQVQYFGTALCSFILSVVFTEVTNWIITKDKQISIAIKDIGNEFERLCEHCYRNVELVQFTLKNDKCYVGWVQSLPIPSRANYIKIFPVYSGYRKKETKELVFTTQYLDIYASYVQSGEVTDVEDLTTLVIKIDEIISANSFNDEMYDRFQNKNGNTPAAPIPT
ncbi:hypothetical protein WSM22_02460 [Cytophagales bacterium WSM2-2]|nr:hypothetical protein WSM22_02460 [Cytophagales bacterium WSM2-2]